jgi:predicted DCC family thiol-disulfide oxidoreductase YuxK
VNARYSYRTDAAVPQFADDRPIVVFDGHCALCSGLVQFILRHDRAARFRLLAAQSPIGEALYLHYGLDPRDFETYILIERGTAHFRSEATIRLAEGLGFPWAAARLFRIVPAGWRDRVYDFVARHRFHLFGRRSVCFRPDPRFQDRFL